MPTGVAIAYGSVAIVAAALIDSIVPRVDGSVRIGLIAVTVAVFAAVTANPRAVVALVPLAWLVVNGFLVDRLGELAWHGTGDVYRALLLVVAGGLGLVIGAEGQHA